MATNTSYKGNGICDCGEKMSIYSKRCRKCADSMRHLLATGSHAANKKIDKNIKPWMLTRGEIKI